VTLEQRRLNGAILARMGNRVKRKLAVPAIKLDVRELTNATALQAGALVRALIACYEFGGFSESEIEEVCGTADESALAFVRSRMVLVGEDLLTHPETLARRAKASPIITRGQAGARDGLGGVFKTSESNTPHPTTPNSADAQAPAHARVTIARGNDELEREAGKQIEAIVSRMRERVNDEGMSYVMRVMGYLERDQRTHRPRRMSVRLSMWQEAAKYPPEQFAIACYTFAVDGPLSQGKPFKYLMGICRRSAASAYVEERAAIEKQNGFKLEGGLE
jgi:hypothetical protein